MKPYIKCAGIAALTALSITAAAITSTSAAAAGSASKAPPAPVVAPDTPEEQLALRLSPLTRDDLAQEAKAWLAVLKSKTNEVVEKRIALKTAQGANAERLTEVLGPLTARVKRGKCRVPLFRVSPREVQNRFSRMMLPDPAESRISA